MTKQVNVTEAKTKLSQLIDDAAAGEDVVIARAGRPVVRLVPMADPPARVVGLVSRYGLPGTDLIET